MTLRVGVIGAGIMGTDHADNLFRWISGAEVAMISDVDPGRAELLAGTVGGVLATDDNAALIDSADVDAVIIASHDSTHAELVRHCLRAGKPVLCEKPLAPTLAESVAVWRDEQERPKRLLSLGFMRRFDPAYVALKRALDGRAYGSPLLLHCIGRGVTSGPGSTSETSVTNSAIHELDVVPWLLGSPVAEAAWLAPKASREAVGLQDPQLILLRTEDGVLSTIETFLNARYGYDIRCEVVAEQGALSLGDPSLVHHDHDGRRSSAFGMDWRPRFAEAYRLEVQAWVDALVAGTESPLPNGYDGVLASAVAAAVIASMHAGGGFVAVDPPH